MAIEAYRGIFPRLGNGVFVHPSATVIGDVVLEDGVSVWPGVVIRGDVNAIRIGAGSNIQDNAVLHVTHRNPANPAGHPLTLGRRVTVGHGAILHGCEIGDECLVGMGALVLDAAVLRPRVLLGAGALATGGQVLESGWIYTGRPAQAHRPLTDDETAGLARQAERYLALAAEYLAAG